MPRPPETQQDSAGPSPQIGLIVLRRWWKIALPAGLVCAAAAGVLMYFLDKPRFTASSWLVIQERVESLLPNHGYVSRSDPRRVVANQFELIKSPIVLEPVASLPSVAATPELKSYVDIAAALRKQLKISGRGQSEYFVIEFTSVDPQRAADVVNAVSAEYLNRQKAQDDEEDKKLMGMLMEQQKRHDAIVKRHKEVYTTQALQVTGKDPFAATAKEGVLSIRNPLSEIESKLVTTEVEAALLRAQLQARKELLNQASFTVPQAELERAVQEDGQVVELRSRIATAKATLREHERTSVNLAKNRLYQDLKARLADDEANYDKLQEQLRKRFGEELATFGKQRAQDGVAQMESDLATKELMIQLLKEKYELKTTAEKRLTGDTLLLEFAKSDFERSKQVLEAINVEIERRTLDRGRLSFVSQVRKAAVPTMPDVALAYKKIAAAAGGALLLPFGLALVLELLYRRVDNRRQLESTGNLTVVGEVTELPRRSRATRGVNREAQLFEESIHGLRTYFTLADSLRDVRVLAVTSAVSREGKTSLATQLAISIAKATGEKTLLMDGDMRSPDIHRVFDVECKPGLAEVLRGDSELGLAIETAAGNGVDLLTAGMLAQSPHHVLGKGEFKQLLLKLRETYHHIVIDTPPILPASEALVMARAADAAVLCVRRDYSRLDQVAEAHQRLLAAGVKTVGAVLSGIPTRHYAYKYGGYYYSESIEEAEAGANVPA
jgi:capsular exopolysaccharide synthesis family protein